MLRSLVALGLIVVLVTTIFFSFPSSAKAEGNCFANPSSAPVGTTFQLDASGFSPNTTLFAYAVDPNGTAFSDPNFNAFGGTLKSNGSGGVSFSFRTRFDVEDLAIARAFGTWHLVVQQLGAANSVVAQATCILEITPNGSASPVGATLMALTPTAPVGSEVVFYATNFAPSELVNLWVSPPPGCTSFGYGLKNVLLQYATASAFAQDDVRADGAGEFAYKLPSDRTYSCPGDWALSAFAPGSKKGAIAFFTLTPQGTYIPGQPTLLAAAASVVARLGTLEFSGYHYMPDSIISCWLGRPDLTVRFVANYKTNAAGAFWFSYQTGFDDEAHQLHYSEGTLGKYSMSCRDNESGAEATATFILTGGSGSASSSSSSSTTPLVNPAPLFGPLIQP